MKIRFWLYIIFIELIFVRCVAPTTYSVVIKKNITNKFVLGKDTENSSLEGLWWLKYEALPDTSLKFEGIKHYILVFSKPTSITQDKNFILMKRELEKEPLRLMIIKLKEGNFERGYPIKTEKKYIELRKKLNVPDSLTLY